MARDFTTKQKKAIQDAHAKGKRTVMIDGVKFAIRKDVREVQFTSGGEQHKRKETWLVAQPADGRRLTPVYSVAPIGVNNSRATTQSVAQAKA